jgi:hypothetical protein
MILKQFGSQDLILVITHLVQADYRRSKVVVTALNKLVILKAVVELYSGAGIL